MKTVAIIQARMGSSRLFNKMLLNFHGYSIIDWIYHRVLEAKKIDQLIFALPNSKRDDVLSRYLESIGATVYRGSENDLVDRYFQAAKVTNANQVVRICADNPLICGSEIDRLVYFFDNNTCDYAYNHIPINNLYPDGLGAEICSVKLLEKIQIKAKSQEHREHVFNYIWDNSKKYLIKTFDPPNEIAFPDLKLDIDTIEDYQKLCQKNFQIDMTAEEIVKTAMQ